MIILLFTAKLAFKILLMHKQLNLYSTSHCHLCELAYDILVKMQNDITVNVIEITENEALFSNYGMRIPVLARQDTRAELNWPFSEIDIRELLK